MILSLRGGLKYTKAVFDLATNIGMVTRDAGLSFDEKLTLIVLQTQRSIVTLGFGWVGYLAGAGLVGLFATTYIPVFFGGLIGSALLGGGSYVLLGRLAENLRIEFEKEESRRE